MVCTVTCVFMGINTCMIVRVKVCVFLGMSAYSVAKLCPTLCNPVDCSPQYSSVHGISQARIPEWVVIPFSRGWIFLTQGSKPYLLHWQVDSLPLSHQGSLCYLLGLVKSASATLSFSTQLENIWDLKKKCLQSKKRQWNSWRKNCFNI